VGLVGRRNWHTLNLFSRINYVGKSGMLTAVSYL